MSTNFTIYRNTPENAASVGWKDLEEYWKGDPTAPFVSHNHVAGTFTFLHSGECYFCGSTERYQPNASLNFCSESCELFYAEEKGDHKSFVVAVYLIDQAKGGIEEGGWYYTYGQLVRQVKTFRRLERALDYMRRLNVRLKSRKFGPNFGRRDIGSVLSEGEYAAYIYGTVPPKRFPETKPRYE